MNIVAGFRGGSGKYDKLKKRQRAIHPGGEIGINLRPYRKVNIDEGIAANKWFVSKLVGPAGYNARVRVTNKRKSQRVGVRRQPKERTNRNVARAIRSAVLRPAARFYRARMPSFNSCQGPFDSCRGCFRYRGVNKLVLGKYI